MVRGVGDRQEALGPEPVGEEVVEHAAVVAAEHRVLRPALGDRASRRSTAAAGAGPRRPGPRVSISPMCETSNIPAPVRTATCSGRIPSYCTGISQPANGTSLAPARSWRSKRGVRRRVAAAGSDRGYPLERSVSRDRPGAGEVVARDPHARVEVEPVGVRRAPVRPRESRCSSTQPSRRASSAHQSSSARPYPRLRASGCVERSST